MLSVQSLSVQTKQHKSILNDISLSVKSGDFVVILGPNGAGKSTLLKAISGDTQFQQGDIEINGKSIADWKAKELAFVRSVMPQKVVLEFPFLASEVVAMGRSAYPDRENNNNIIQDCMALMDITHLADRLYPSLSGGEQQRVQLARVLAQIWNSSSEQTRYLLLDECTSALDPYYQHRIFQILQSLKSKHIGLIAVVHDLNLAAQYADKVLLMKEGKTLAFGDKKEVLTAPLLASAYNIDVELIRKENIDWPYILTNIQSVDEVCFDTFY